MFKSYKKTLIVSSLVTLLPIAVGLLLWDRFPEQIASHWGWNGEVDGWASAIFVILWLPITMLAIHWFCIWFTFKDPGNHGKNKKPLAMVLWIVPFLSNLTSYLMYALALGAEFSVSSLMVGVMGLMFAVIGNYLPKCKMNSTIGIKVPWTYTSEANWNATHRFGGKLWVTGGIVMILSAFLPGEMGLVIMLLVLIPLTLIPMVYSYMYYRKQKAQGEAMVPLPKTSKNAWIALVILLVFVASTLFAGELEYEFDDKYLTIDADFYNDLIIDYNSIASIEYRDGNVDGIRVGGYGSFRLLMGYFQNDEFGVHIRYTYYKPEACIVVKTDSNTFVLSGKTKAETQELFTTLQDRAAAK